MKKKILCTFIAAATAIGFAAPGAGAATESWRDAFVTRLMKTISQDPSYTDVVLTDLDQNGTPEAFVIKKGTYGGIGAGFTVQNGTIVNIEVPQNIIGECLENINVYIKNDTYIFVGQEVPRYTSHIAYYKLTLSGNKLNALRINKSDVSPYTTVTYVDKYSSNLLNDGYPDRTKISAFINSYDVVNTLTATKSSARVFVNGTETAVTGYSVDNTNYFKIRDIATVLRGTGSQFNVEWNETNNGIDITTGAAYVSIGGELVDDVTGNFDVVENSTPTFVNGKQVAVTSYVINGSSYFKIRDIADIAGCEVQWDDGTQIINLVTE